MTPMPIIPEHTKNKVIVIQNEAAFVEVNDLEVHNGEKSAADTEKPILTEAAELPVTLNCSSPSQTFADENGKKTSKEVVSEASTSSEDAINKEALVIPFSSASTVNVEDLEGISSKEKGKVFFRLFYFSFLTLLFLSLEPQIDMLFGIDAENGNLLFLSVQNQPNYEFY